MGDEDEESIGTKKGEVGGIGEFAEYECGGALDGFRRCSHREVSCLQVCEGSYDSIYVGFCECDGGVIVL